MSTFSPLTTSTNETTDRDSRQGATIDTFIIHHSADTSQANVLAAMQPGGRDVSANYALKDKSLVGVVDERYRAWTSGSPDDGGKGAAWDRRSITIEVQNSAVGDPWPVSDESFDTLARLIADCAKRYGFAINDDRVLTHQELYKRFGASYPTACPGDLQRRKAELLQLANTYWAGGNDPSPAPLEEDDMTNYPRLAKGQPPIGTAITGGSIFSQEGDGAPLLPLNEAQWKVIAARIAPRAYTDLTTQEIDSLYRRVGMYVLDANNRLQRAKEGQPSFGGYLISFA